MPARPEGVGRVANSTATWIASFAAQADALADVDTLKAYTEWMKWLLVQLPDGSAEVRAFAVDEARSSVTAFGVFHGTHPGEGGPVPATGRTASADFVYVMDFDGPKIRHMTKIWNDGWALRQLGWAG